MRGHGEVERLGVRALERQAQAWPRRRVLLCLVAEETHLRRAALQHGRAVLRGEVAQAVASAATPRTVDATVPPAALAPRGGVPHAREQAVQRGGGVRIGAALLLRARHEELREDLERRVPVRWRGREVFVPHG